jgi:hypothetical protein
VNPIVNALINFFEGDASLSFTAPSTGGETTAMPIVNLALLLEKELRK